MKAEQKGAEGSGRGHKGSAPWRGRRGEDEAGASAKHGRGKA